VINEVVVCVWGSCGSASGTDVALLVVFLLGFVGIAWYLVGTISRRDTVNGSEEQVYPIRCCRQVGQTAVFVGFLRKKMEICSGRKLALGGAEPKSCVGGDSAELL
jgi:hypothetical protein